MTVALIGTIGWQAFSESDQSPPMIVVETGAATKFAGGWVVEVRARNLSARTASDVEIEGVLRRNGSEIRAGANLGYVPGHSTRDGGLFLPEDPRGHTLEVRAIGYSNP